MSQTKPLAQPETEGTGIGFGARYALILVSLLLVVQLLPIVGLLGGNAQSEIAIHFRTTHIAWFTLIGALVGTFVLPFVMKLAGLYGKKRLMVIVLALGLIGDLVAALATDYQTLLIGRGIAGLCGPAVALAYAMARDAFPHRLVGPANGILGGGVGLTALGGPFLSGWLIDSHGFRGALWFMVIATALTLLLLIFFVPESPVREERTQMDWLGGVLLGGGLTAIVYAVGHGSEWGWTSGEFLVYLGGGLVALVVFLFVESRAANPLLPLTLLSQRRVWTVLLATAVAAGSVYAVGTVMQLLALMPNIPGLSDGLGWSATKNAMVTAPMSVVIILMAVVTGTLARRIDPRILLGVGSSLTAVGFGLTSQFHGSVTEIMITGFVGGIGMGMIVSIVPAMIIASVEPEEQALGNGTQNLLQGVAQVLVTQLAFVVMAQDGQVMKGTQFYADSGFTKGFWLVAGFCAAGALLAALIPKVKPLNEVKVGQASS
ncbi:MFS transporter [Streptomyces phaeoluteigriseus]